MPDPRRRLGALGEQLACDHLEALGYELLDRNFRTRNGEIDIVARDGRFLVFCEVKARAASQRRGPQRGPPAFGPLMSVDVRKRRQVRRMAAQWLGERSHGARSHGAGGEATADSMRFDAIGVTLSRGGELLALDHIEDAF